MPAEEQRRAVVLMNLGGPDSLDAVRPFLSNLFSDPAILDLPAVLRRPLAWLIAARRAPVAREIYTQLGGASPLLANTEAQARALEAKLGPAYRCFVAMRYWHPLTGETVAAVKDWAPDEIILLPLYPQYSRTTAGSSLGAWEREAASQGLAGATRSVGAFYKADGFVAPMAERIAAALGRLSARGNRVRVLFSAHGLPVRLAQKGDPYPGQVAATAEAVAAALARPDLDWRLCWQSRVGPLKWLEPSVADELARAGRDGVAVVIAPISFVSEHSETLVELDRDYRRIAEKEGVPAYCRVATVGTEPRFIAALADRIRQ
jgi:ferrochelatase